MQVVLSGATGLVGSAVLDSLRTAGHEVTALVRSEGSASTVRGRGATAAVGDITDREWLHDQVVGADAFVHTASPGDASSADFDRAVAETVSAAFEGTGKVYVHTGGVWVWGSGVELTEDDPFHAPRLTAWRADVEKLVLDTAGVRGVVIAPAVVYGHGSGLSATVAGPADDGRIHLIGDGSQHWATVGADQLADLYRRAVEDDAARGYYIAANDDNPTVREIGETAARVRGVDVVAESVSESGARLGELLAEALLLDQQATGSRARTELGWRPAGASLLAEIESGSYGK